MKNSKWILSILILVLFSLIKTYADDDEEGEERENRRVVNRYIYNRDGFKNLSSVSNVKFKSECTSCHKAYLPGLLPARSWKKMMAGLNDHFGESAVLDEKTNIEITDFLVANAADQSQSRRSQKIADSISSNETPLRISETYYFKRKHHELSATVYKRKKIGSPANCFACHSGAESGNFNEHEVRIPKD